LDRQNTFLVIMYELWIIIIVLLTSFGVYSRMIYRTVLVRALIGVAD
jgi:hypothetical protein